MPILVYTIYTECAPKYCSLALLKRMDAKCLLSFITVGVKILYSWSMWGQKGRTGYTSCPSGDFIFIEKNVKMDYVTTGLQEWLIDYILKHKWHLSNKSLNPWELMGLQVNTANSGTGVWRWSWCCFIHKNMTVTLPSVSKWVTGLYMTQTWVSPCRVMGQSGMRCQLSASDLTPELSP